MLFLDRYEEYLILPNQADVFYVISMSEEERESMNFLKNKTYVKAFVPMDDVEVETLQLDHPEFPYDRRPSESNPINTLNMFLKMWQCNVMMKAYEKTFGCKYSRVVRLRTDMAIFKVASSRF